MISFLLFPHAIPTLASSMMMVSIMLMGELSVAVTGTAGLAQHFIHLPERVNDFILHLENTLRLGILKCRGSVTNGHKQYRLLISGA